MSNMKNKADGVLAARLERAYALMSPCGLCPRKCLVQRDAGEVGFCRSPAEAVIASAGPHFGEEAPLVGIGGSGTIFLAGCNLRCVFCQNYDISHNLAGTVTSASELARLMLDLQRRGCHNINFVTPSHSSAVIMDAIIRAREQGLRVPIVYNCGGYEWVETLRLLDGLVEIYMPDFKFWDRTTAATYCSAPDYPDVARAAFREMHRQVGDLVIGDGLATRGLLVRHLVMPGQAEQTKKILGFLASEISPNTFVNVMGQYRPTHNAAHYPEINRRPADAEVIDAKALAARLGLRS
jgi:putative pyruvate formate lyase activating enzyme